MFYSNWANRVNEQSNGKLKIEVRDGETLANFITAYDRVNDDVVQIGWIIHSLVGNRFPLSDVSSLPFLGDNNVGCSVASWRLYKSGLLDNEYKDIVPIWFGCLTTTYLHWAKEPKQIDDLGGAKFRVNGKIPAQAVQLLGGTPISMTGGEMYEALQRGTVDGVATSWAGFEPYKLARGHDLSSRSADQRHAEHAFHVAQEVRVAAQGCAGRASRPIRARRRAVPPAPISPAPQRGRARRSQPRHSTSSQRSRPSSSRAGKRRLRS